MKILMGVTLLLFLSTKGTVALEKASSSTSVIDKVGELLESNNHEEALNILSQHVPKDEEFSQYHYLYGKALSLGGRSYDSVNHFRLAYLFATNERIKENALIERARAYLKSGFYEEATICFRLFLIVFPQSPLSQQARIGLAESTYKLGLFEEAMKYYEEVGNSLAALYGKANCLQSMGKTKEAYDLYMHLILSDPGYLNSSHETRYNLAENLRQMGKLKDARIYLTSAINESQDPLIISKAEISLGLIEAEEKNFELAIKFLYSASKSHNRQIRSKALLHLADTYMKMQRYEDATSVLLDIRNNHPYSEHYDAATLMLARLYKERGMLHSTIELLKELIFKSNPNPIVIEDLRAILIDVKGKDPNEFLNLWNASKRLFMHPSESEFLIKIAEELKNSGKPFLELASWLSENGLGEAKRKGRLYMAEFFADMGDEASALKYIADYQNENNDDLLRIKAKILKLRAEYNEAFKIIRSIGNLKEKDLDLLSTILAKEAKNKKEVLDFYEKSLNTTAGLEKQYVSLADALYENERQSDALRYYKTAASMRNLEEEPDGLANNADWANYMISRLSKEKESKKEVLSRIQQTKGIMGHLKEAALKELEIEEMIKGESK